MFNQAANSNTFSKELLEAIIITLPKSGKDPTSPLNYRPISLLNSDLKIYAKILANRIVNITPLLIKPDQVGFVKGRQAPDSTRRMLNIINLIHNDKTPSLLLALDAEKAFDRMHWEYISQTLTKFGFQGFIHSAIMALYTHPTANIFSTGMLSRNFSLTNGTRQGCPLSPLIFSLAIEPLAEYIRSSPEIKGITIGQDVHKLGLFADDIILTLTKPDISLPSVITALDKFKEVSYYNINQSKCHILPMNIPATTIIDLSTKHGFNWDNTSITSLGIQLTSPPTKIYDVNFPTLLEQINRDLMNIQKTHLSWVGKIAAFKMQTLPKILYYFRCLPIPIPAKFFTQLNTKLKQFIWNKKKT